MVPKVFGARFFVPIQKLFNTSLTKSTENVRCFVLLFLKFMSMVHWLVLVYIFGFKKSSGYNYAILSVKCAVDYFVKDGFIVDLCTLDVSKAFETISHTLCL